MDFLNKIGRQLDFPKKDLGGSRYTVEFVEVRASRLNTMVIKKKVSQKGSLAFFPGGENSALISEN